MLQKGKAKINLVLTELDLPDMHGYKLLRWICRNTDIAVVGEQSTYSLIVFKNDFIVAEC